MRYLTTLAATSALAIAGTHAAAGGLAPEVMEAPVVVEEVAAPAASSISPTWIVLGVLAALLVAANLEDEEDTSDNMD